MILFVGLLNSFASFAELHCCLFFHCRIVKLLQQPLTVILLENNAHFSNKHDAVSENFIIVYRFAYGRHNKANKIECVVVATKGGQNFNYSVQFGYHYFPHFSQNLPFYDVFYCNYCMRPLKLDSAWHV